MPKLCVQVARLTSNQNTELFPEKAIVLMADFSATIKDRRLYTLCTGYWRKHNYRAESVCHLLALGWEMLFKHEYLSSDHNFSMAAEDTQKHSLKEAQSQAE